MVQSEETKTGEIKMASAEIKQAVKYEQSHAEKFKAKFQAAPFVPIGIAGMAAAVGWGAYQFRHRGKMSPSVFLMHLRVKAQGMVVGAITLGVGYTLLRDYVWHKEEHQQQLLELDKAYAEMEVKHPHK